jgi:hypothetical protein
MRFRELSQGHRGSSPDASVLIFEHPQKLFQTSRMIDDRLCGIGCPQLGQRNPVLLPVAHNVVMNAWSRHNPSHFVDRASRQMAAATSKRYAL